MNWLRQAWLEVVGLFVDDGSFALVIAGWVLAAIYVLPRLLPSPWRGPVFFVGVVLFLAENVTRTARKFRNRRTG